MKRGNSNEKIIIDIFHNIFIINRNIKNSKIFAKTVFPFKVKRMGLTNKYLNEIGLPSLKR